MQNAIICKLICLFFILSGIVRLLLSSFQSSAAALPLATASKVVLGSRISTFKCSVVCNNFYYSLLGTHILYVPYLYSTLYLTYELIVVERWNLRIEKIRKFAHNFGWSVFATMPSKKKKYNARFPAVCINLWSFQFSLRSIKLVVRRKNIKFPSITAGTHQEDNANGRRRWKNCSRSSCDNLYPFTPT